jgi:hypothetical protein
MQSTGIGTNAFRTRLVAGGSAHVGRMSVPSGEFMH